MSDTLHLKLGLVSNLKSVAVIKPNRPEHTDFLMYKHLITKENDKVSTNLLQTNTGSILSSLGQLKSKSARKK